MITISEMVDRISRIFLPLVFMVVFLPRNLLYAQEFNCTVTVNHRALSGSDFTYLQELEERLEEYYNMKNWTDDKWEDEERIECTIQITFEEALTLTSFKARIIFASRRPIYNTTQYSTVVQFNDTDWLFEYPQGGAIIFDVERYDPLTSLLDFYAFIMLGYDYDTFDELGGTPYFETARRIAEKAEAQGAAGWSQIGGDRGKLNLITQLLDPRFRPLRKAYFDYHFLGLDHFVQEAATARAEVLTTLEALNTLFLDVSRQYVLDLFFSAKYQELAAIFEDSQQSMRAFELLTQLDPAHLNEYNRLTR